MIRPLVPALALAAALPAPAGAQEIGPRPVEPPCLTTGGRDNCAPLLACIGNEGRWFRGRATGWNRGRLAGRISDGAACEGAWVARNRLGLGQADVAWDDGMRVTVYFYYQDSLTGTALGRGVSNRGAQVRSFSGRHVLDYLTADGQPRAVLPCGADGIELDGEGLPIS